MKVSFRILLMRLEIDLRLSPLQMRGFLFPRTRPPCLKRSPIYKKKFSGFFWYL